MCPLFVLVNLVTITVPNERAEVSQAVWRVAWTRRGHLRGWERTFAWLSSEPDFTPWAGELDVPRKCQRSVG